MVVMLVDDLGFSDLERAGIAGLRYVPGARSRFDPTVLPCPVPRHMLEGMGKRMLAAAGCVCAVLLVTGCAAAPGSSGPSADAAVEPIEIVSQPEAVGDPVSLDIPLDESGAFVFDRWPSACALTDEATLSAILPQLDGVAQSGRERKLRILSLGGPGGGMATVPEADCETAVGFPVDGLRLEDGNVAVSFTTTVEAAGSAEFVERNTSDKSGTDVRVGGASCVVTERRYDCQMQSISFGIVLDARPYGQYFGRSESAYVVDGEQISYSRGDVDAFLEMAEEKILLPVVAASVDRLG
ncbi:hypothetical protein D1J51_15600 [Leucobacter sp. wl10]|nr:hypothetical protein D1J51_15600 [Leucobacter sp. wl10]